MQFHGSMIAVLLLTALSSAPGLSTDRFMGPPESLQHVKEDAMHMWRVADMELHEASVEKREAHDALADGKAIEKAAVVTAKFEEARAKKELKGKDLDAALAAFHDEEAGELKDAKQMEYVAMKEESDAKHTEKEGERVRQDATAIESSTKPTKKVALAATSSAVEVEHEKADVKQMRLVADIEEREAAEEQVAARDGAADGKAIERVTKSKDELTDARQMEAVATKEARDAAAASKDVARMRKDAAAIEAALPQSATKPAKKVALAATSSAVEVEHEKADVKQMRLVADIEEREAAEEQVAARDDAADGKAIERVTKSKDELTDARQMEAVATKEARDAAAVAKDVERMRKDAAAIETTFAQK